MDFEETFADARTELGLPVRAKGGLATPASLLSTWDKFAEICELGFDGYLDEYYNFLGVRSVLFQVLTHRRLVAYPEIVDVAYRTAVIDRRLVACFDFDEQPKIDRSNIPDGSSWYWNHFPLRRGSRFAEELLVHYQLHSKVIRPTDPFQPPDLGPSARA